MLSIPLSSDYKASILNADSSFDTLKPIEPVLENGEPKFASGAFAIVFKMQKLDEDKNYAIKCFTTNIANRNQRLEAIYNYVSKIASTHFAKFHFLPKELWVNITPTEGYEYPIVAMEWIEGKTLGETLRLACEANDTTQLRQLLTQFIDLALMLMALPIAHGDLKHDNIIVDKNGTLVLVDYDGMFVPALKGEQANELGSEDYQHQSRNASIFDRHIDDWSIAIIALSIAVLIQKPSLYAQYNHGQNLIFSRKLWQENKLSSIIDFELHPQVNSLLELLEFSNQYHLANLFNSLVELREVIEDIQPIEIILFSVIYSKPSKDGDSFLTKFKTYDNVNDNLSLSTGMTRYYWSDTQFEVGDEYEINLKDYNEVKREFRPEGSDEVITLIYLEPLDELCDNLEILNNEDFFDEQAWWDGLDDLWKDILVCNYSMKGQKIEQSNSVFSQYSKIHGKPFKRNEIIYNINDLLQLTKLNCGKTEITSLGPVKVLANLIELLSMDNHITSLEPLKDIVNLMSLNFGGTKITSLEPLKGLIKLTVLVCSRTQITSLEPLKDLVNLTTLWCADTKITSLEPLKNLVNLTILLCMDTQITSLEPLKGLVRLTDLWCSRTQIISLEPLKDLVNLTDLWCSRTQITSLEPLIGLVNLIYLECAHSQIKNYEIELFKKNHPKVIVNSLGDFKS